MRKRIPVKYVHDEVLYLCDPWNGNKVYTKLVQVIDTLPW
jgi:hypothetical protein